MNSLLGMPIKTSHFATQTVFKVERWPSKKKRRGWMVVKKEQPCAFIIGPQFNFGMWPDGGVIIHPDAMKHIQKVIL